MNRSGKQFQRVKASVKLGVEAMKKLSFSSNELNETVECHNCHEPNSPKRCFCSKCGIRLIHSYG